MQYTPLYCTVRYNQANCIQLLYQANCKTTGTVTPLLLLSLGPGPFCLYVDNVDFAEYTPSLQTIRAILHHTVVPEIVLMRALKFVEQLLDRTCEVGGCEDRFLSEPQRAKNIAITSAYYHRTCGPTTLWRDVQKLLVEFLFVNSCKRMLKKLNDATTTNQAVSSPGKRSDEGGAIPPTGLPPIGSANSRRKAPKA